MANKENFAAIKIMLKFLFVRPKLQVLNVLRCEVTIRTTISLLAVVLLAVLVSGCPSTKKRNSARDACARISNTVLVGNECLCMQGYTKISHSGAGSYDFHCQYGQNQTCYGNARMVNGMCQCNNGRAYNTNNMQSPCGEFSGARMGLTMQQLQSRCSGVGQWQNELCMCPSGQWFNALSSRCESIMWHHTQSMCGTGATFYGHGNRGVCVCQNDQALFHPSFGGCSTHVGTNVLGHLCSNVYGVNNGFNGGHCQCPAGRVWFRGSCLDLGHDFVTQVPNLPSDPALRCELQGRRLINGQCETYGGGYIGHNNGPSQPIICRRDSLIINMGKETVELHRDRVRVTIERGHSSFTQDYHPQEYFRIRCEDYALSPGPVHYWARGIGRYEPGNPPYFGECRCAAGYTAAFDHDLGYSYCVAVGHQMYTHSRCEWASLCGGGLNINIGGADRKTSVSGEICLRDGTRINIGVSRPR